MRIPSSFIILAVLIAGIFCEESTTNPSTTLPTDATTLSTESSTSQETTTARVTTSEPETTTAQTTIAPTTTLSPTTTTIGTTSTKAPTTTTTTTTTKTTTTTPAPVTSTKSPEPPVPDVGSWNVTDDNVTCIRADLRIRFDVYLNDKTEYIVLSPNASSSGDCSNVTQVLEIHESDYSLVLYFGKDATSTYVKNITFSYTMPDNSGFVYNDTKLFPVKIGNSYLCSTTSNVILRNVTMEVYHIRIQSFGTSENKDFGTAEECEADNKVNDIVPIAVGIALLALVVVVLIAYFVGRRRSRQKGYQSV